MAKIERQLIFSEAEYDRRMDKVRRLMERRSLDVLILHSLPSIHYLTGFQSVALRAYAGFVVGLDDECTIVVERDEQYNVLQNSWVEAIATYARSDDPVRVTSDVIRARGKRPKRIGMELGSRYLSKSQFDQLSSLLEADIVDATDVVPGCMVLKSPAELRYIEQAAAITVKGVQAALDRIEIGRTDNDIAAAAFNTLISQGSESMSSDPIVCVGQNSSIPHGHFKNRPVRSGDTVLLEMSACVGRYSAPLMRAVSMGRPDATVAAMASACREAVESLIHAMKPGASFADAAAKGKAALPISAPNMIFHGTYAYSIGLGFPGVSWADSPLEVRDGSTGEFEPGMVFHLPMSLRYEGLFGVAVSETVAITDKGCKVLTEMSRELFTR
jgi:Xaa-Pro dipeptidase